MNNRLTEDEVLTISAFNEVTAILKWHVRLSMPALPNEHKYYEDVIVNGEVNIEKVMHPINAELTLISNKLFKLKELSNTLEFSELHAIVDKFSTQVSRIQQFIAMFLQVMDDLSPFDNQLLYQSFYHLLDTVRQISTNLPTIKYGHVLMYVDTKTLESFINLTEIIGEEMIQLENQLLEFSNAINDDARPSLAQMIYSTPQSIALFATLLNDPDRIKLDSPKNDLSHLIGISTDTETFAVIPEQAYAIQKIKSFMLSKHVKESTKEKLRSLMIKLIYLYGRDNAISDLTRPLVLDDNRIKISMPPKDYFSCCSSRVPYRFSAVCNESKIVYSQKDFNTVDLQNVKMNVKNLLTFINLLPEDTNHLKFTGFALPDNEFVTIINTLPEHINTITFYNLKSQAMHNEPHEQNLDVILKSVAMLPKHIEVFNLCYEFFINIYVDADSFRAFLIKLAANLPNHLKEVQIMLLVKIDISTEYAKQIYDAVPNHIRFRLICKPPFRTIAPSLPNLIPLLPTHIANHLLAGNLSNGYNQEQMTTLADKLPDTDELDLSHAVCFTMPEDKFVNSFEKVIASTKRRFHTLNLSHNGYCTHYFSVALQNTLNAIPPHIEKLDLSNNNIGLYYAIAIEYINNLLEKIPNLYINLANNQLYLLGVNGLIGLFAKVTENTKIDLRGNLLGSHFTLNELNEIFSSLPHADLSNFILDRHTLAKLTEQAKQHFKELIVLLEENQEPDAAFIKKLKTYFKLYPDSMLDELESLMRGERETKLEDITLLCAYVYEIIEDTSQKNSAVFKRASFLVGEMIFRSEVDPSWSAEDKALYKNIKQRLTDELPTDEKAALEQQKQTLAEQKQMFTEATLDKLREARPYIAAAGDYPYASDLLLHIDYSLKNNNKGMYKLASQQLLFPEASQSNNNDNSQDTNSRPRKIQKTSD